MNGWRLRASLDVAESPSSLAQAYAREVRWAQGFRVNADSRLLLLGLRRLLARKLVADAELRTAGFVIGCRLGAMDSYESFDDALAQGKELPLAFAYALPSMPLACASICHGLRGVTYTVTGEGDAGVVAFHQAAALLEAGAANLAIAGCWESPSATAGADRAVNRLLLLVLEQAPADGPARVIAMESDAPWRIDAADTVATLERFLAHNGMAAPREPCHA